MYFRVFPAHLVLFPEILGADQFSGGCEEVMLLLPFSVLLLLGLAYFELHMVMAVDRVLAVPSHSLDGKKIDPKHATPKSKSKNNKTKKKHNKEEKGTRTQKQEQKQRRRT